MKTLKLSVVLALMILYPALVILLVAISIF